MHVDARELIPDDSMTPLLKCVNIIHYVDGNIFHDHLTGYFITFIIHFSNKNSGLVF